MAKREIITKFSWILILILILVIFRHWISLGSISAGDLGFFYPINIKEYWQPPLSWESFRNSGLGGYAIPFQGAFFYNLPIGILSRLVTSFSLIQRLVWFWPILVFSLFSSWFFSSLVPIPTPGSNRGFSTALTVGILVFNTYFFMVLLGGQITVALAYAIFPLVLALFLRIINQERPKPVRVIVFSLALALLVAFDLRFAYLFFLIVFFYFLFHLFSQKFSLKTSFKLIKKYCLVFIPAGFIATALHLYWLLPLFLIRRPSLPAGYDQAGWVEFLSFADFSQALSLLHPNWPEGIFGKTYFMRPEFLILPILAFSSLLFITNNKSQASNHKQYQNSKSKIQNKRITQLLITNYSITFFASLALIGAFLAKGSNPPFGEVYLWLFNHFPGMNMFRDPTKFYVLVAVSYSVLIPFSVSEIYTLLSSKFKVQGSKLQFEVKSYLPEIFVLLVACYWLLLIRPAWVGQLGGTFRTKKVPREYLALKDFVGNQDEYFRTFWVPQKQRFGFYANSHPAIAAEAFVTDSVCREPFCSLKIEMPKEWGEDCLSNDRCYVRELSYFLNPKTVDVLAQLAVKYVIVPFDSEEEIFIAEYKYNPQQRKEVEEFLDTIPWFRKINLVDKMAIYEVSNPEDHFFVIDGSASISNWKRINPTKYLVSIQNIQVPFRLVFSESFDNLWQAKIGEKMIPSIQFNQFNSFWVEENNNFQITIEFTPQKYVYLGGVVSLATLVLTVGYLLFCRVRQAKT